MDTIREHRRKNRPGVIVVEAAIVFPLLLILTIGAIEYGLLFLNEQQITNAARQGARIAILNYANAEADARALIDSLLGDDAPTVTITSTPIPGDPDGRPKVTVTVSVNTANLPVINAPLLFPMPDKLSATVTMAGDGI
jgi:Flp pilus assembly protein TadG